MLSEWVADIFTMVSTLPPSAAFLAIILATFILEDVAIVSTGLLASTGMIEPVLGGAALLTGIVLGDLGLFLLGRGAARTPGLKRYVDTQSAHKLRKTGTNNIFSIVFSTRFVPGMRLPTYTGLGYVGASFWRFMGAVIFAVTLWTVGLYSLVVMLGGSILEAAGPWKWIAVAVIIATVVIGERLILKRNRKTRGLKAF